MDSCKIIKDWSLTCGKWPLTHGKWPLGMAKQFVRTEDDSHSKHIVKDTFYVNYNFSALYKEISQVNRKK